MSRLRRNPSPEALVMAGVALVGLVRAWFSASRLMPGPSVASIEVRGIMDASGGQVRRPLTGAPAALATPVPAAEAVQPPPPPPQPTPVPTLESAGRLRISNTDGEGVVLRSA